MTENILDKWGGANSWFCLNRNFSDRGNDGQCQEMGQSSPLLHFAHKMWPNLRPVGWLCLSDLWVSFFSGPPTSFLVCETSVHSQNPWCGTICVTHTLPRVCKILNDGGGGGGGVESLSCIRFFCNPWTARLLCLWEFPGKNTGVGCHILLLGISPTQGSNPHLLHWQVGSLPLRHLENHLGRMMYYLCQKQKF